MTVLERHYDWLERMGAVCAGGFATLSKNPDRFPANIAPGVISSARGCHIIDVDGNRWIDTVGALGAVLFGHGWGSINCATKDAINQCGGPALSLGHYLEIEVAELLAESIVAVDTVRFCKNGADATQAAIRVARQVTSRRHILCSGYHGHHDWYISSTDKSGGVLSEIGKYTHQFEWGNREQFLDLIHRYGHDLACVILEIPPLPYDLLKAHADSTSLFLDYVQATAMRWDALFILDEIVTGFRYGLGGAGALYGCTPDLICLGKAMANGWPLAAIGGDSRLMEEFRGGGVFLSTTNGGDVLSLAAAKASLIDLQDDSNLERLWHNGRRLGDGLSTIIKRYSLPVELIGNEARMVMKWYDEDGVTGDEAKTAWLAETAKHGVLFGGPIFPTVMMERQDVDTVLDVAHTAGFTLRSRINAGNFRANLPCPVIEDVFSKRYRANDPASALSGV